MDARWVRRILAVGLALGIVGVVSLADPVVAQAATVTTSCINTTYVDGSSTKNKARNFGSATDLAIAGTTKMAFIECAVSNVPAGEVVTGAQLKVWSRSSNTAHTVQLHNQPTAWTENTVTWNTLHTFDSAILSSANGNPTSGGDQIVLNAPNVTGNGTWRFALDSSTTATQLYGSDDYTTDTTVRPSLVLTTGPAPTTTTTPPPTTTTTPPPTTTTPPPPPPGWTEVVNDQFETGGVPAHWSLYDGPYGSDPFNCAIPSHATVSGGYLHMLMSYEATTPTGGDCGPGWYTAGMQLSSTYAAVNQRVTLRWRMVSTDPAQAVDPNTGVISHNNMPMHFGNGSGCWPTSAQGGETDYMEGADPTTMGTFIHYGSSCGASTQFASPDYTSVDFRQFHTVRAERDNHTVKVYIDDMVTPIYTKVGDSSSIYDVAQRAVLQQECRSTGCPATTSPTNTYTADVQVDWITIENKS